jgi:hypothetical protein
MDADPQLVAATSQRAGPLRPVKDVRGGVRDTPREARRPLPRYELTACGAAPCIVRRGSRELGDARRSQALARVVPAAARRMGLEERILYHQAHPMKLVVDAGAGFGALGLFWAHAWGPAVVLGMGPPALASVLVIGLADLESVARTRLGGYVRRGMILPVQLLRLGGYLLTGYAAWNHSAWILAAGLFLIVSGWLTGAARARGARSGATLVAGRCAGPAGILQAPDAASC